MSALESPILLCATTRSGTTLLSLMLGHHPRLAFVGEYEWVWDVPGSRDRSLERYHAGLAVDRHFLTHRCTIDPALSAIALARSFLEQMAEPHRAEMVAFYGCQVHRHYRRALEAWPDARVIHLVRDGRDVCASWIKFGWVGNGLEGARHWNEAADEWRATEASLGRERYIEVRFEDILRDTTGELTRIADWIGVGYDARMLSYPEHTTYSAIDSSQSGKWRRNLARRDLRLFEGAAGDALRELGYALSGHPPLRPPGWATRLLSVDAKLKRNASRIRTLGLPLWLGEHITRRARLRRLHDRLRLRINDIETANLK